jgi:tetratricopeptide (TPR) repeat protein
VSEPAKLSKESLHQIIQMQPGTESAAKAHFQLGGLHLDGGEVETATEAFRQVPAQWAAWHARAGFAIARIYETHLDDIESAAREYRKVISLHPDSMSAAHSYQQLALLHQKVGDPVSAENMRECSMRTYERLATSGEDADERDEARFRFAVASRELQRWDQAVEALQTCRKRATRNKDAARRYDIDRQLGVIALEREQHAEALKRFKDCLEYARRRTDVPAVVELNILIARTHQSAGDDVADKRTRRSLVDFVHRSKKRLSEAQLDPKVAPALVECYLKLERVDDAKALRTRLRRFRSPEARELLEFVSLIMAPLLSEGSEEE